MSKRRPNDRNRTARTGRPVPPRLETSAGGVVFRRAPQGIQLLLIRDPYRNWGLPKGHVEKGESAEEAALREVREETGLHALRTVAELSTIDWYFRDQGQPVHKFCHFFLMESCEGEPEPQADEGISACAWLSPAEAVRTISYDNARQVVREAVRFFGEEHEIADPQDVDRPTAVSARSGVGAGAGSAASIPAPIGFNAAAEASTFGETMRYLTIPNLVTATRFPLAAAFVLADTITARAVILAAAAASDWIDGWLARRLDQHSRAGELLDPMADKIFVLAALVSFAAAAALQPWELLLLILRDLYATSAFFIARARRWPMRFRARFSGKVVTGLQIAAILVLLIWPPWSLYVVLAVAAVSLYAIVDYTRAGLHSLREHRTAV